eukprot:6059284-Prymnesium_polylepis.3
MVVNCQPPKKVANQGRNLGGHNLGGRGRNTGGGGRNTTHSVPRDNSLSVQTTSHGLLRGRWPMLSPKAVSGDYARPA